MRRKRNQFTYDPFLPVSKIEAENALETAEEFVKIVLKLVQKENPQLRFNFSPSFLPNFKRKKIICKIKSKYQHFLLFATRNLNI